MRIVVGTANKKKLAEIRKILEGLPVELLSLEDFPSLPEVVEDAPDFEGNARKKALEYAAALDEYVVADDSGLEVDALGGRPGVLSARYAGPDAADADLYGKLLGELEGVPDAKRTARFRCVIAFAEPGRVLFTSEGSCEGFIADASRGNSGFGYDPVFYYPPFGCTFAEASPEEKNAMSHRGKALAAFKHKLANYLQTKERGRR